MNKFAGLSRDWVGGKILFIEGEEYIGKIPPPQILAQSRENFLCVFLSSFVFVAFPNFLVFLTITCSQNLLVDQVLATPQGQLNWISPIATNSPKNWPKVGQSVSSGHPHYQEDLKGAI